VNVLFVATEGVPFIKTGGLADVVGSLPKELVKQGVHTRVILPKYGTISPQYQEQMSLVCEKEVVLGWRKQECKLWKLEEKQVVFYFVENDYYYNRENLYGYFDEAERFSYFCRAVLELLPELDFKVDVLHCHDWQTGLIPLYLKDQYIHREGYSALRTVFTIHNLQYQGVFEPSVLNDIVEVDRRHFTSDGFEFYGQVNFMKAGLVYSDLLTTVSKTYANEVKTSFYGESLDGLLCRRENDLVGIVNGIDYESYDPKDDPALIYHYDASMTIEEILRFKQKNKMALQTELGLPIDENVPMLSMVTRLVSQKGLDLVERVIEELLGQNLQLVVLGTGEERYERLFKVMAAKYPEKLSAQIQFDDGLARRIYAGSDLFLMPSKFEPCGIGQLIALRYGTVPIVRETGGLVDTVQTYNEFTDEGYGFSFSNYNAHDMLYTIQKAVSTYQQREKWGNLVLKGMKKDFSWSESAIQYSRLYR